MLYAIQLNCYFEKKERNELFQKWLCIKPGIQDRGTECGERGEWGECYIPGNAAKYSGECTQTFRGISSNIPGNIVKNFGECTQTFRGMLLNIPTNVLKHSPEYRQTFRGMLPNIPGMSPNILGNVVEHSGECPIYFDGRELVEASSITFAFSVVLSIVCSVIFCIKDFAKLLAARLNSGENLISRS